MRLVNRIVQRLIIRYMLNMNAVFSIDGKTVRVFSDEWYKENIKNLKK